MASAATYAVPLAILSAALFGAATPASKWLLGALTPFQLAGLLYLGAALATAPTALRAWNAELLRGASGRRNVVRIALASLCGGVLGPVALLTGLKLAGAASVSVFLSFELVATAVIGVVFFRDQLSRAGWVGVATGVAAATVLSAGAGSAGVAAALFVLLACVCWGIDNQLTALIDAFTPSQSTFVKGSVAGVVNLAIGAAIAPFTASAPTLLAAIVVGAACYGLSIVLYIRSAQHLGATRVQVLFATAPLFGAALAIAVLGEPLTLELIAATGLFAVAAWLLSRAAHEHEHTHEAIVHTHSHRHDDGHHSHAHPGLPASTRHTHPHAHEPITHRHEHAPDLHHRHRHESVEHEPSR